MFDWNDEELANIIWGEAGVSDDHIVPYPERSEEKTPGINGDCIKKEPNQEATNAKPAEQKKAVAKTEYSGGKQEGPLQRDTTKEISSTGYSMDPWPHLPLTNALKTDQDFMGTEISNNLSEITKFDSSRGDETSQLVNDSEVFHNQHEDLEQSDFVDYDWANVGSFDDLDRIFSNGDAVFGHASVGNTDELWSSSKDVTSSPEKIFPLSIDSPNVGFGALKNMSVHFDVKTEYVQDQDQSSTHGSAKMSYLTSHAPQNLHASAEWVDNSGGKTKPVEKVKSDVELLGKTLAFNSHLAAENITTPNEFTDEVKNQKRSLKGRKKSVGCEEQLQDSCCTWSPHANQFERLGGQISPSIPQNCTPVICQQTQLQGPASSQYQHYPNPFVAPSEYESSKNQYSTLICLPQINGKGYNKATLPGYEVSTSNTNPSSRSPGASTQSLIMTPQEKIEKLRRRQQMQALLAIQEQQQQLSHQVSGIDHSIAQMCVNEKKIQLIPGGNIEVEENVSALPSVDPNSPIEQDDSNTITMAIDEYYSVEDAILHQLQDIIARLDIRTRLCIRDSLFRLAQSATRRHYVTDTSSTNKNCKDELEAVATEETSSHSSFTRTPNVETQTNPIDRTVAHLLFHRPLELSGIHPETPESPASTKLPCERNNAGLLSSPRGFLPDHFKSKQNPSHQGSKNPHLFPEGDRSRNSLCVDTSDNASKHNEVADRGGMEIEASR